MKKLFILLLTILGIVRTSSAQPYNKPTYAIGDTVEQVDSLTIQLLDMSIENMSFENATSIEVINVFYLIDYYEKMEKFIPSLLGTKIHFQVTDEDSNFLDLHIYLGIESNLVVRGMINGRTFATDGASGDLYYDDSNELLPNVEWNLR